MREIDQGDGWKVREIVEPKTAKIYRQYFYKNKRAPRVELTGKIAKQLAGYVLIEKDLRSVIIWLKEIEKVFPVDKREQIAQISPDREVFNIVKGLYVAALTFYGKCFTSCEGRGVRLRKNMLDAEFLETHQHVMHMRHTFAAHSGADNFEEVKIALILYPNKKGPPKLGKELAQVDMADSDEDEKRFLKLVEHVRSKVIEKVDNTTKRIYEENIVPKGIDYWYRKTKKS